MSAKQPALDSARKFDILELRNSAILCPTCRRKIRGVRIPPGGVMLGVSIKCRDCGAEIIAYIDQACATYESPRR